MRTLQRNHHLVGVIYYPKNTNHILWRRQLRSNIVTVGYNLSNSSKIIKFGMTLCNIWNKNLLLSFRLKHSYPELWIWNINSVQISLFCTIYLFASRPSQFRNRQDHHHHLLQDWSQAPPYYQRMHLKPAIAHVRS